MADSNPTAREETPLGLANPLLPPTPLGYTPRYPQFLVPVATKPLMAANPSMLFPKAMPEYQTPENPFQESPFFAGIPASPRIQAFGLPEVLQRSRLVEGPILKEFEVTEGREIQRFPSEEVRNAEVPTIPQGGTTELISPLPETSASPSSPKVSPNPLPITKENAGASPTELSLQKAELVEPKIVSPASPKEAASPAVIQPKESSETTPAVVSKSLQQPSNKAEVITESAAPAIVQSKESTKAPTVAPELTEQSSDGGTTVFRKAELSEKTEISQPTATSSSPKLTESITEVTSPAVQPKESIETITPAVTSKNSTQPNDKVEAITKSAAAATVQPKGSVEVIAPAIASEPPESESIEQSSDGGATVFRKAELSEKTKIPEPITTSSSPKLAEIITEVEPSTVQPKESAEATTPAISSKSSAQPNDEAAMIKESSSPTIVQSKESIEPSVVSKLPKSVEKSSDARDAVFRKTELSEETAISERITTNSPLPKSVESITEVASPTVAQPKESIETVTPTFTSKSSEQSSDKAEAITESATPSIVHPKESAEARAIAPKPPESPELIEQSGDQGTTVFRKTESPEEIGISERITTNSPPPKSVESVIGVVPPTVAQPKEYVETMTPTVTSKSSAQPSAKAESVTESAAPANIQPKESIAAELNIVSKLPESIEKFNSEEDTVFRKAELSEKTSEPTATAKASSSSSPAISEESITGIGAPETIAPQPELMPTPPITPSAENNPLNLKRIAPEAEEISESPEVTAVQNAVKALQPNPLTLENFAPPHEATSEIAETPVSNPEIISAKREAPTTELSQPSAEPAPPIPADSEHAGGPEPIQSSERLPSHKEHLGSPSEIIPAIEPFLAVQNLSEEATPAEPLAAKMQEIGPAVISPKEAAISPKNDPEAVNPPVSSPRSQELIARQIKTSNDLEQKGPVDQETITSAPAIISPKASEENIPAIGVEENASSGLPAPKSVVMRAADSEEPITTPLKTAPPLAQLSNFLPITADPLSTVQRAEMPLGLEQRQPMTFSPSTLSPSALQEQHLLPPVARAELSPVIQPLVSPSVEKNAPALGEEPGNLNKSPIEMSSAALQEELPIKTEASYRMATPIQKKEDFAPLIFAQSSLKDTQTKIQKTPAPDVPLSINSPTEQSSLADGISRKTSFDRQEFTSLFGSQALIQRRDIRPPDSEVYSYSLDCEQLGDTQNMAPPTETEEREESKLDFEAIAHEIYGLLRHRLEIEKERQGLHSGRLPW
jgi:hypothetical protein